MSDSSIGLKPVIEEPSKPIPPSNASSSSEELIEKLFSCPSTSVNQRRTKRTSLLGDERDHVLGGLRAVSLVGHSASNLIRDGLCCVFVVVEKIRRRRGREVDSKQATKSPHRSILYLRQVSNRLKVK